MTHSADISSQTAQAVESAGTAAADEYTSLATRAIEECTDAKPLSSAVVIRASVDRAVSLQGSGIAGSTKPYTAFEVTVVVGRLPAVAEDVGHWTLQSDGGSTTPPSLCTPALYGGRHLLAISTMKHGVSDCSCTETISFLLELETLLRGCARS